MGWCPFSRGHLLLSDSVFQHGLHHWFMSEFKVRDWDWDILTLQSTCTCSLPAARFGYISPLAEANPPPWAWTNCGRTPLCTSFRDYSNALQAPVNQGANPTPVPMRVGSWGTDQEEDAQLDKMSESWPLRSLVARHFPLPLAQDVIQHRNPTCGIDTNTVVRIDTSKLDKHTWNSVF